MIRKILIANRGEIACRIARTLRRMGIAAATVHSTADAGALHVREIGESVQLGGATARESYLDSEAVLAAARQVGADAIHPGFGFLSENADFARRCGEAGITFIGPAPETLVLFGDKSAAKKLARSLDIPTAAGLAEPCEDVEVLLLALAGLPMPCILKPVAGGGGKGMRIIRDAQGARGAIEAAIREGRSAFGDGRLIAEQYLPQPRHVEVQILGDGQGHVVHLFDRECSLQRRYQKVVEEAPVTSVAQSLREQLWAHALALGRASRYLGLGTVEFAVTGDRAVFLEVNPRLQVEHPVTEAVTGLDLVQLQVETVAGRTLPFSQESLPAPRGVAVQARLYAEDVRRNFMPATGRVAMFSVPDGVRCDAGVAAGSEITPHYDPMVAKLVAHAADRGAALARLREALAATTVLGVTTNRGFLVELLGLPDVRANAIHTETIDAWLAGAPPPPLHARDVAAIAALWLRTVREQQAGADGGAWGDAALTGWRLLRGQAAGGTATHLATAPDASVWRVGFRAMGDVGCTAVQVDDEVFQVALPAGEPSTVTVDGCSLAVRAACDGAGLHARLGEAEASLRFEPLHDALRGAAGGHAGLVRAPMMGIVVGVQARAGDRVAIGDCLATMESMKMEMALNAPVAGVVTWVGCAPQGKVERHQDLFRIEPASA